MISISRNRARVPPELVSDGAARLTEHRRVRPRRSVDFDRSVYGSESVKSALHEMQHAKCCYCEKDCECRYEDVEHFRPKTEAIHAPGRIAAGYWWLAYAFDNLLFACRQCNATKGSRFPLTPGARALVPEEHPATTPEEALLLDPTRDRPEEHLTFQRLPGKGYQIAPRNGSARGRKTIEVLGLDRDDLTRLRLRYYKRHIAPLLKRFHRARAAGDVATMRDCHTSATALAVPDAPFSLFARSILTDGGLLAPRGLSRRRANPQKKAPPPRSSRRQKASRRPSRRGKH